MRQRQCRRPQFNSWVRKIGWRRDDYPLQYSWSSLVAQLVKNLPAMWKTRVQFLGWEDPLEKGKATHSSILAWRIPWTIESMGLQRVVRIFTFTAFVTILLLFWFFGCLFCFFTARHLGSQFPNQGSNLCPPPLGGEV